MWLSQASENLHEVDATAHDVITPAPFKVMLDFNPNNSENYLKWVLADKMKRQKKINTENLDATETTVIQCIPDI
jgi:hypothetical protein